jgi:hypothetical protein
LFTSGEVSCTGRVERVGRSVGLVLADTDNARSDEYRVETGIAVEQDTAEAAIQTASGEKAGGGQLEPDSPLRRIQLAVEVDAVEVLNRFEKETSRSVTLGGLTFNLSMGKRASGYRYVESILPVDTPVYVLGSVGGCGIRAPESQSSEDGLLIGYRSEEQLEKKYHKDALTLALASLGLLFLVRDLRRHRRGPGLSLDRARGPLRRMLPARRLRARLGAVESPAVRTGGGTRSRYGGPAERRHLHAPDQAARQLTDLDGVSELDAGQGVVESLVAAPAHRLPAALQQVPRGQVMRREASVIAYGLREARPPQPHLPESAHEQVAAGAGVAGRVGQQHGLPVHRPGGATQRAGQVLHRSIHGVP